MQMPPPYDENNDLNVIIETPKGNNFKTNYDPKFQLFRLAKALPVGMHFPYDFGFIPGTIGEDGDPLDILVLSAHPLFAGCWANVSLIGVLEAEQTEKNGKKIRNDRLIGCLQTHAGSEHSVFTDVKELPRQLAHEIEAFFIQYNRLDGKDFKPLGWQGPKHAQGLLQAGIKKAA